MLHINKLNVNIGQKKFCMITGYALSKVVYMHYGPNGSGKSSLHTR